MKTKWIVRVIVLILLFAGAGLLLQRTMDIKNQTQQDIDSLNMLILARGEVIWQAMTDKQVFLDSVAVLNTLNETLEQDYLALKNRKIEVIEEAKDVPPDTAYQALQDIYPDQSEKIYPLSPIQIKNIYIDVVSVPYLDSSIIALERRSLVYGAEIALYKDVVREDSVAISNLEDQGADYREVISLQNQQIISRDKKLRRDRFLGAGIGAGAFILGVLVGK